MGAKISIFTRVYNTKAYLNQCISSVLSQTYRNFEFIILDNGSTDGCAEILRGFATEEERIQLIRREQNRTGAWVLEFAVSLATGTYFTVLDSDDWWEPDYLERLVALAEENRLDIICTGTVMHHLESGTQSFRKVDQSLIFPKEAFAEALPWYHAFFRTTWGKLIRIDCMRAVPLETIPRLVYGGDTCCCFQLLRHSSRIGIDNSLLHHYRIHKKSISYQYFSGRFDADVYLYNDTIDFLSAYGPVSTQNQNFLQIVYSNALVDTLGVIRNASLTPADKLREYRTIATHPLTQAAYRECTDESAARSRVMLLNLILQAGTALGNEEDVDLQVALQALLPDCGKVVRAEDLGLFTQEPALWEALKEGDRKQLAARLLGLIAEKRYTKRYDLGAILHRLLPEGSLLQMIEDTRFFQKYAEDCAELLLGNNITALDHMTGLLLNEKKLYAPEQFLDLYLSLAAMEDQAPAFIFGKLQLAKLYLRQGEGDECRAIVEDLTEMGLDNEELFQLRRELGEQP